MPESVVEQARILIVDDVIANVHLLESHLKRAGYIHIRGVTDPHEVVAACDDFSPDLILLDLRMPDLDGIDVMNLLGRRIAADQIPVLVLTADLLPETKVRALAAGARDFLTKPFEHTEVLLRIANLLETRFLHLAARGENLRLETEVRRRTADLERAQLEILERLARAAEFRDDATQQHTARVGYVAGLIAAELESDDHFVETVRRAASLHDVGKIGIPDAVLLKPGPLTIPEFEVVKTHTTIGAAILSGGSSELVRLAQSIALSHHERWDGFGYPEMRAGESIPREARIVTVADAFDALTHSRPYKDGSTVEQAIAAIRLQAGRQFDPEVVDALIVLAGRHVLPEAEILAISLP
jgi:putative two-component system response regulator